MKKLGLVTVLAVAACGDGGSATPDAEVDAQTMCPAKTAPLAPGMHKIYLNFDGATLSKGNDNAPLNISSLLVNDPTTIPPYGPNLSATTRQGRIDVIVDYVQRALAPYSVDIVTTRPITGPYFMNVLGGLPEDIGFGVGNASIAGANCMPRYNAVGLEFDQPGATAEDLANTFLSDIAMSAGMGLTSRHNDCANRMEIYDQGLICSFDAASPTVDTANCGRTPTQDEPKLLMDAFGCRD